MFVSDRGWRNVETKCWWSFWLVRNARNRKRNKTKQRQLSVLCLLVVKNRVHITIRRNVCQNVLNVAFWNFLRSNHIDVANRNCRKPNLLQINKNNSKKITADYMSAVPTNRQHKHKEIVLEWLGSWLCQTCNPEIPLWNQLQLYLCGPELGQLVCLLPIGMFNLFRFIYIPSVCYKHITLNKN